MRIAARVAYSKNIVPVYDVTLSQRYSSFATMLFEIQNEPFHSRLLPVVDDCLHRTGFKNQTVIVTIQTIRASHDRQPIAWRVRAHVVPLAQVFRNAYRGDSLNLDDGALLTGNTDDA
jgi:hypothetical protein